MTWVPPSQRSTPSSSTRSSSPWSTRSPSRVSRIGRRAKTLPSLSGGGGGRASPSSVSSSRPSSVRARKNHASPRKTASSSFCAATNAAIGVLAPASIACSARRSVPGEAVGRRRQLLEQPLERRREERQTRRFVLLRKSRQLARIRRAERLPHGGRVLERVGRRRAPRRPEALELVGAEGAEERVDDEQLRHDSCRRARARGRRATGAGRSRSCSNQSTTWAPGAQRVDELLVAPLERREDRPPAAPAPRRQERGTLGEQLPTRKSANRPLVQDVLPRQHGSAERRLPQRVAGALAVRDVQQRRRRTFAPRRARYAAPHVQWSSESHAQPTTRASSSRIRCRPAMRKSISSIFAAMRTRNASDGFRERFAARRYSSISASVKPTACASLIARRKRTVSSS